MHNLGDNFLRVTNFGHSHSAVQRTSVVLPVSKFFLCF